jgi:hypothetical protein
MTERKQPNMHEKLAAAYLSLVHFHEGRWQSVVDRMAAKDMTAQEICSLFEVDHYPISVFMGGTNHPTNLMPLLKADHRQKTYKKDALDHARVRRAEKAKVARLKAKHAKEVEEVMGDVCSELDMAPAAVKVRRTEANKAYAKLIYQQRKVKRKAWLATLNKGKKK